MQSCCLEGCESYKYISKQKIGYFKFPINNKVLLKKWLNQIRIPNWHPTEYHQICSTHFHVDDIDFSCKIPKLKGNAVPMIFPLKHFQSIYIDELTINCTKGIKRKNLCSTKIQFQKETCTSDAKKILHKNKKPSSMVLLCTPTITEQPRDISNIRINSISNSNLSLKKVVPIKNEYNKNVVSNPSELSHLSPYILIVSDNKEKRIPLKITTARKKHAVLKIQIDKKNNILQSTKSVENLIVKQEKCNQTYVTNQITTKTNCIEEVEVDDTSSSKVVIFKFDPITRKITVLKKEKLKQNNEVGKKTSDGQMSTVKNNLNLLNGNAKENHINVKGTLHEILEDQVKIVTNEDDMQSFNTSETVPEKPYIVTNRLDENQQIAVKHEKIFCNNKYSDSGLQTRNTAQKRKCNITTLNSNENESQKNKKLIKNEERY